MSHPANPPQPEEIALNERAQMEYLLGNPPSWMMRYGISVLASFFFVLLALAWFVRYPDIVEAPVVLTTANPPIRVMAKSSGRVVELLAAEGQEVEAGAVLAVLENTARWRDVLQLESWLDSAAAREPLPAPPTGLRLGDLQGAYSAFTQHWKDLDYFTRHNGVAERIGYVHNQISQLTEINANLRAQQAIMRTELALTEKEYRRQQRLHADGVIADKEFEATEMQFLAQNRQYENTESAILQNQMQVRQLEGQINDLRQNKSDSRHDKFQIVAEDQLRLQSAIAAWKQQFLVQAPIGGQVVLAKVWSEQQPIAAGEEVLALVPGNTGSAAVIGKAEIPVFNSGKIAPGMRAIIRLDGLPAQQYGVLEGRIATMALLPQQEGQEKYYQLDVCLLPALTTSTGVTAPFRPEMTGILRIATDDRRVLERVFGALRDLLRQG